MKLLVFALTLTVTASATVFGQSPALTTVPAEGFSHPVANSSHGWQFTPQVPIKVTHLGLWDSAGNGFLLAHPLGLYRLSDGALLTSGATTVGTANPLVGAFRYVDTPDVALDAGAAYVVAYHTASDNSPIVDNLIVVGSFEVNSAIRYDVGRWGTSDPQLTLPMNVLTPGDLRIGPNFLFVPEPTAAPIALMGAVAVGLSRRRA